MNSSLGQFEKVVKRNLQLNELFMREIWKSEKVLNWSRSSRRKAAMYAEVCKCGKKKWQMVDFVK